jgi:hypothetical protein
MLAVLTPGAPLSHSHSVAACDSAFPFEGQGRLLRSRSIRGYFPVHFIPAYNLPVYASQWPLPDTTQDSVRGRCARLRLRLGFTAAAISGDRLQRAFHGATRTDPYVHLDAYGSYLGCLTANRWFGHG